MPSSWFYFKYPETAKPLLKPFAALIAIGILVGLALDANNYNKIIKESELVQIMGILTNQPTIETASEGGPWVPIKLKEFPYFKFDIDGTTYDALRPNVKKFVKNAHIGDTLTLDILKYDLDTKIKGIQRARFSERIINYRSIQPFTIKLRGEIYMSLNDVNKSWADNHDLGRFLVYWLAGISLIVGIAYLILHLSGGIKKLEQWFPGS